MRAFDLFLGIDYSGAKTPASRLPGLQVYAAEPGHKGCLKVHSPNRSKSGKWANWTRAEVAALLLHEMRGDKRVLAGIDHCFSMPWTYFRRYGLGTWPEFLDDFVQHWPTHGEHVTVDHVREGVLHRDGKAPPPNQRIGGNDEFRLAERWTSSAKSVFQFDMQGSVAKSSHAGIPWLKWLRDQAGDRIHFWPFDGWKPAPGKSVILEVYPSLFRNRYGREDRTADEQDAFATPRWMADMDARGVLEEYFSPPLTDLDKAIAACEGWIFGVR
jgi:hypothetical protein